MSHSLKLSELELRCSLSGDCSEYYAQLRQEENNIILHTASANQTALAGGLIIGVIGFIVLLTPFVKRLQRLQIIILPKLAIAAPVITAIVGGTIGGMVAVLGACFGRRCSTTASWAWFIAPIIVFLIMAIPATKAFYKRRENIAKSIALIKPLSWIIVGLLMIVLAVNRTVYHVIENRSEKLPETSRLEKLN